jgi:hypothetical protein
MSELLQIQIRNVTALAHLLSNTGTNLPDIPKYTDIQEQSCFPSAWSTKGNNKTVNKIATLAIWCSIICARETCVLDSNNKPEKKLKYI